MHAVRSLLVKSPLTEKSSQHKINRASPTKDNSKVASGNVNFSQVCASQSSWSIKSLWSEEFMVQ